jgi:hypothetical protein
LQISCSCLYALYISNMHKPFVRVHGVSAYSIMVYNHFSIWILLALNCVFVLVIWVILNFHAFQHTFPRTLEGLVLNILGPTGAEILTRKFDEMDQQSTPEEQWVTSHVIFLICTIGTLLNFWLAWYRAEFYKIFYSAFNDQYAAMDVLLNRKELFSFQVLLFSWSFPIHKIEPSIFTTPVNSACFARCGIYYFKIYFNILICFFTTPDVLPKIVTRSKVGVRKTQ